MRMCPYFNATIAESLWLVFATPEELIAGGYYPTINANDCYIIWRLNE